MRTETVRAIDTATNRAGWHMTLAFVTHLFFMFVYFGRMNERNSAAVVAAILVGWCFGWCWFFVSTVRFVRVGRLREAPRLPAVRFDNVGDAPAMRLESRPRDNQLLRSRFQFGPSDYRLLVRELRLNDWKLTRAVLVDTKLFDSITAPGVYRSVVAEFERLEIVRDGRVTGEGKRLLCAMGNMQVIP